MEKINLAEGIAQMISDMINNYNLPTEGLKITADTETIFDIEHVNTYIDGILILCVQAKVIGDWIFKKHLRPEDAVKILVDKTVEEYHTYIEVFRAD